MTAERLIEIVGIVLSLAFSYIPGLADWYGKLNEAYKRLIMLGLLVVTSGAIFGIACGGWLETGVTCDQPGLVGLLKALLDAIIVNQVAYQITPWSRSRAASKLARLS